MYEIADFLISKTCDQHRKFGHCGCRSRNSKNPCETTAGFAADAIKFQNLEGVLKRVGIHKCASHGRCNHKGCIKTEQVEQRLVQLMTPMPMSKAA